jgi:TrmH family RNA methyltransferase
VEVLVTEEALGKREIAALLTRGKILPQPLAANVLDAIADAETPQGIAAEIEIPAPVSKPGDYVFLEGVQDAGNVGAILRTAAAFGVGTVVLDRACADPWSPKVLRAGMGGHFALSILQVEDLKTEVGGFKGQLACTVARDGAPLKGAKLAHPLGWIFGSEGRGVSEALQELSNVLITIPLAPGTESLNVAAAAAICLYQGTR